MLAAWSGWGAVPEVFDPRNDTFTGERQQLRDLLSVEQYRQAEASVLNAHYTDPAVVAVIWQAMRHAGFTGGRVLEPGCGSGTFIGHAPDDAVMIGVENDAITAAVAAHLYPSAQIRNQGFEATRVPENSFALTVGNVPFGRYVIADPSHNPQRFSVHNHFICKSLALTAPGGYVAVLTSRYTLDSAKPAARRAMAAHADLVGAIRLPSKAFARVAGTDVVTDLLILRRREPDQRPPEHTPEWVNTTSAFLDEDGEPTEVLVNSYYAAHPHHVLGTMTLGHGLNGSPTLAVDGDTGDELAEQLVAPTHRHHRPRRGARARPERHRRVADRRLARHLRPRPAHRRAPRRRHPAVHAALQPPTPKASNTGPVTAGSPIPPPKTRLAETRELIALRDVATSLITSQRDGRPPAERDQLRGHLNTLYDNYVRRHGPVNRFTWIHPKESPRTATTKRLAAAETRPGAKRKANPAHPTAGPSPTSSPNSGTPPHGSPRPVQEAGTPRRRHAPRPRLGGRVGAGNLRRRHRPSPQSTHLLHRPAHPRPRAAHRRHPRRCAGDEPGPHPARRHRLHLSLLGVPVDDARALSTAWSIPASMTPTN